MKVLGSIVTLIAGVLLIIAAADLPDWADPHAPIHIAKSSTHYITKTFDETTVPNLVTAVLADYRGYDTMFETTVVFIAGMAILAIVGMKPDWQQVLDNTPPTADLSEDPIIRHTCRILMPVIVLFGFYVIAHGHHSPGGGFQGGVILGGSLIMVALAQNLQTALFSMPISRVIQLAALGIFIYAGLGLLCLALGENFLDYAVLSKILPIEPKQARSLSMLWVEIGVAFTVSIVMFAIYAQLSTRGDMKNGL